MTAKGWAAVAILFLVGGCDVVDPTPIDTTSNAPKGGAFSIATDSIEISSLGEGRLNISIADTTEPAITATGPFTATIEVTGGTIKKTVLIITATAPGIGYLKLANDRSKDSVKVVATQVSFRQIAMSSGFACGIASDGRAWCWGGNTDSQLGTTNGIASPCSGSACQYSNGGTARHPLPIADQRKFSTVAVTGAPCSAWGISGTCGGACALTPQGETYCWGNGVGMNPVLFGPGRSLSTIQASGCGLDAEGEAYCLTNSTSTRLAAPLIFSSLSVGSTHSCGVSGGDVYCWGANTKGQLGIGTIDANAHPTPEKVVSSVEFTAVSVGTAKTCAISSEKLIYCWGSGFSADETTTDCGAPFVPGSCVTVPRAVQGGRAVQSLGMATNESFATAAVCGLVLDGSVDCWTTFNANPSTVLAPFPFEKIAVAGGSSALPDYPFGCGLTAANGMYCWTRDFIASKKTE